jgi:predicted NAD/FAD-binding protein
MRIAVVGTGISGLVASYLLAREHDVTVFEAADYVGGHTSTVTVDLGAGPCAVDTGFIVFNHRTYPGFTRLLAKLGVRSQPSLMSFSVQCERTGLEWSSRALFAQPRNLMRPAFLAMLVDIVRFYRTAGRLVREPGSELTVRDYLRRTRLSQGFVDHYLVPLGASMWSCPPHAFLDFPMRFLVRFMENHGMLSLTEVPTWRTIEGGSQRYVEALTRTFRDRIRLRTKVVSIRRHADRVELYTEGPGGAAPAVFDHVVVACHSDQALTLLADPSPIESEVLAAIPYQTNDVVLHTDVSLLPRSRRAWAAWNYHVPAHDRESAVLTYDMNILQSLRAPQVACVTVNDEARPRGRIDPAKILRRFRYHHPVFKLDAPRMQAMHERLIHHRRTSYCGAYWGFGFHEDGVQSALAVGRAFGLAL